MSGVRIGVRVVITLFILILLTVVTLGWSWTRANQPPRLQTASHVVLGISGLAGILALARIWRPDPPRTSPRS
jgi:hypothetical protein